MYNLTLRGYNNKFVSSESEDLHGSKPVGVCVYTGWPKKNGTVDFLGLCSDLFSPCWIEHLFLIIITSRSSNSVENLLFYE